MHVLCKWASICVAQLVPLILARTMHSFFDTGQTDIMEKTSGNADFERRKGLSCHVERRGDNLGDMVCSDVQEWRNSCPKQRGREEGVNEKGDEPAQIIEVYDKVPMF